jgi:hypothetical protein
MRFSYGHHATLSGRIYLKVSKKRRDTWARTSEALQLERYMWDKSLKQQREL